MVRGHSTYLTWFLVIVLTSLPVLIMHSILHGYVGHKTYSSTSLGHKTYFAWGGVLTILLPGMGISIRKFTSLPVLVIKLILQGDLGHDTYHPTSSDHNTNSTCGSCPQY